MPLFLSPDRRRSRSMCAVWRRVSAQIIGFVAIRCRAESTISSSGRDRVGVSVLDDGACPSRGGNNESQTGSINRPIENVGFPTCPANREDASWTQLHPQGITVESDSSLKARLLCHISVVAREQSGPDEHCARHPTRILSQPGRSRIFKLGP